MVIIGLSFIIVDLLFFETTDLVFIGISIAIPGIVFTITGLTVLSIPSYLEYFSKAFYMNICASGLNNDIKLLFLDNKLFIGENDHGYRLPDIVFNRDDKVENILYNVLVDEMGLHNILGITYDEEHGTIEIKFRDESLFSRMEDMPKILSPYMLITGTVLSKYFRQYPVIGSIECKEELCIGRFRVGRK